MKSPLLKNVREITPKEGIRLNRRAVVFFICILISTFLWLVQALSNVYSFSLNFPVEYVHLPKDKVVANPLPENVQINIQTTGFNYLIHKLSLNNKIIYIDVKQLRRLSEKNHYYVLTNLKLENITSQFSNNIRVLRVEPDSIFLNFNKKSRKKVKIKTDNIKISFDRLYQPEDSLKLNPEYITISGAKENLDKIKFVETKSTSLKKIKNDIDIVIDIKPTPELKLVEYTPDKVKAKMKVTKYSEANFDIPIEFEHVPQKMNIKTFPDKINVKCNVSLKKYDKIRASEFRVIVDYLKIPKGSKKAKVELTKHPSGINSIKLNPEKVEYIIRK